MAGVMMEGDEGKEVDTSSVPSIDGDSAKVVESAHLTDGNRAEGVNYNENPGVDVDGPGSGFPAGTQMNDSTPSDPVN